MKTGLVLEGGGMRGIYTIGVLDAFMDEDLYFPYVIGVSAGACNGISYISKQRGRSRRINTEYISDKRYLSMNVFRFLKTRSVFGMDFIFDEIPNRIDPFDYDSYEAADCEFVTGVTDVKTGEAVYFEKSDRKNACMILRASSSIPVFSPPVEYGGGLYSDGGTTDPIPVRKALEDGCGRVVVVLTQHRGFKKAPQSMRPLYRHVFRKYPGMVKALDTRHIVYNETLDFVGELEREGKALVIAPESPLVIDRFEKSKENLYKVYDISFGQAMRIMDKIKQFAQLN